METNERDLYGKYIFNKRIGDVLEAKKGSVGLIGLTFNDRADLESKMLALGWIGNFDVIMEGAVAKTCRAVFSKLDEKRQFEIIFNIIDGIEIINCRAIAESLPKPAPVVTPTQMPRFQVKV